MFKKKPAIPEGRNRSVRSAPEQRTAAVFSYHASRSARPNARGRNEEPIITAASNQRRATRKKWFKRVPVLVGLLLLLVVVALNMPVSDMAKIIPAKDSSGGIFLRPSSVYAEAVRDLLNDYLRNTNKLTLDRDGLEQAMRVRFPELASVSLDVPLVGTRPVVYLEPAHPMLILTAGNDVYVLDQAGRALIAAQQVSGLEKLKLPVVKDESGLPIAPGSVVLPASSVSFITEVVGQLKAKRISVESMLLPLSTSQLELKVQGAPYRVKFNLQGDARAEVGSYLAVKSYLEREHKMANEYIDVRVTDRAYYK